VGKFTRVEKKKKNEQEKKIDRERERGEEKDGQMVVLI
jgi:hypothetical protein